MKYKPTILLFISLLVCSAGYTQVDSITWQQFYGTSDIDEPYGIEKCGEGYLFSISISTDAPGITNYHNNTDAWIVQTDSIGNILWERCFGGSGADGIRKILAIDDTTFYLFGYSYSSDGDVLNGRPYNFWSVKIKKSGQIIWENSYGNRSCDPRDAILTPDGGLLMMGRIMYAGGDVSAYYGRNDIWLCKIDSIGKIQWEKTLGNQGQDNALKIKLTSDSTFVMIGGHYESGGMIDCPDLGTDGADVWIVELDLYGNVIRQLCYGGSRNDLGFDIIAVDSGYVFAASTNSYDGNVSVWLGEDDIWVVKLDNWGNIIWEKSIGGSDNEYPVYITQTEDKGFIVMGNTKSNNGDVSGNHSYYGYYDIWVVNLDSEGELEWQHCFGGTDTERFWGIHTVLKKSDYNYVIAGQANYASMDVECEILSNPYYHPYAWIFEIKDCSLYMPQTPSQPAGPDTLCHTTDSTSTYSISPAAKAWGYEWKIAPEEAGTLIEDSLSAYVGWNQQYEGEVEISARSYNDCGESDLSEVKKTWVYNSMDVQELSDGNITLKVYPNPASGEVIFQTPPLNPPSRYLSGEENPVLIIRDVFGRKVAEIPLKSEEIVWGTGNVPAGLYFYSLQLNDKIISGKLIVK